MATAVNSLDAVKTYTLEEIDDNLSTLANILLYSKTAHRPSVIKQCNTWLDRRLAVS